MWDQAISLLKKKNLPLMLQKIAQTYVHNFWCAQVHWKKIVLAVGWAYNIKLGWAQILQVWPLFLTFSLISALFFLLAPRFQARPLRDFFTLIQESLCILLFLYCLQELSLSLPKLHWDLQNGHWPRQRRPILRHRPSTTEHGEAALPGY